jgi:hypothetical protein
MEEIMRIEHRPRTLLSVLILVVVPVVLSLGGCQPVNDLFTVPTEIPTQAPLSTPVQGTPTPNRCGHIRIYSGGGLVSMILRDGSQIQLAPETEIEVLQGEDCPGTPNHWILIREGQIAVRSMPAGGKKVTIVTLENYTAILDSTALVSYSSETGRFDLECTNGSCSVGPNLQTQTALSCGQAAGIDQGGVFFGPLEIDLASLVPYETWLQPNCTNYKTPTATATFTPTSTPTATETPTITMTPTPTLNLAATATALCSSFHSRFPLTPCPTMKP